MTLLMRDQENQEIGERARSLEIAGIMLRDHEPVEKIVRYTGLSREEVESLLEEIKNE